jgi:hypothetical protein
MEDRPIFYQAGEDIPIAYPDRSPEDKAEVMVNLREIDGM